MSVGIRRGAFVGVVDLQAAIDRYFADHNTDPKLFRWKADPDKIIAVAIRGHQTLDLIDQYRSKGLELMAPQRLRTFIDTSPFMVGSVTRNPCGRL